MAKGRSDLKTQVSDKLVSLDTLVACRNGLLKRIKKAKKKLERDRLRDIKEEIDFLIETL